VVLPELGFRLVVLGDETKPLHHYGKTFEQLAEKCALAVVVLDGLRPNVVLELGILVGKGKPVVVLQDQRATVAVRSFYPNGAADSGLAKLRSGELNEPALCLWSHISDLQGLRLAQVDKDARLADQGKPSEVASMKTKYEKALRLYRQARQVASGGAPRAQIELRLGYLFYKLSHLGETRVYLEHAIDRYQAALRVRTEQDFPAEWARTQFNLGLVLQDSGRRAEARECYQKAARGFRRAGLTKDAEQAEQLAGLAS